MQELCSKLNDSNISDEYCKYAQNIWRESDYKNMGDLYLKSNILLLADYVFEEFSSIFHDNYQLDPVWYCAAPGLAWDVALKLTGVKLELLADVDMLLVH